MLQFNDKEAADLASYIRETNELLEKSQAGAVPVLDKVAVDQAVDNLIKAGFDKKENREKLAGMVADPKQLLGIVNRITGQKQVGAMPALGKVASDRQSTTPAERESDRFFDNRFPASR